LSLRLNRCYTLWMPVWLNWSLILGSRVILSYSWLFCEDSLSSCRTGSFSWLYWWFWKVERVLAGVILVVTISSSNMFILNSWVLSKLYGPIKCRVSRRIRTVVIMLLLFSSILVSTWCHCSICEVMSSYLIWIGDLTRMMSSCFLDI